MAQQLFVKISNTEFREDPFSVHRVAACVRAVSFNAWFAGMWRYKTIRTSTGQTEFNSSRLTSIGEHTETRKCIEQWHSQACALSYPTARQICRQQQRTLTVSPAINGTMSLRARMGSRNISTLLLWSAGEKSNWIRIQSDNNVTAGRTSTGMRMYNSSNLNGTNACVTQQIVWKGGNASRSLEITKNGKHTSSKCAHNTMKLYQSWTRMSLGQKPKSMQTGYPYISAHPSQHPSTIVPKQCQDHLLHKSLNRSQSRSLTEACHPTPPALRHQHYAMCKLRSASKPQHTIGLAANTSCHWGVTTCNEWMQKASSPPVSLVLKTTGQEAFKAADSNVKYTSTLCFKSFAKCCSPFDRL